MIENFDQKTPLDIIFEMESVNINYAYQFFMSLTDYPTLHGSRIINRIIPKAIEYDVPLFENFFDQRLRESTHFSRRQMKK